MAATPAVARLDALGIAYVLHPYDHDPRSTAFGDEAVTALGVDPDRFFKTLLTELETGGAPGRRPPLGCGVVPVSGKLDLRAFARAVGVKRAAMADLALAERTTGYVRGGISPIGQKTGIPRIVDETAILFDRVLVSAGQRGLAVELAPDDLLRAADARYAAVAESA
ncbi:Cys-tRNA(Pro) deacylase [Jatrophihabitans sp. YIM 134969]